MYLSEYTGRGVRIAVIDSGVHAAHPHVAGVEEGVAIREDGTLDSDFVDRLGHGTAVTAAIREKAPDASIVAIKVFWRSLATSIDCLVRAMEEACERKAAVINLSLGTSNADHRALLAEAVRHVRERGAIIVATLEDAGVRWLPGDLDDVVPVQLDWTCDRHAYGFAELHGRTVLTTSGYPRDIPNVSRERNVKGVSFAVANATAFVARAVEAGSRVDPESVIVHLRAGLPVSAVERVL
jgi:subtilisin family serine protease